MSSKSASDRSRRFKELMKTMGSKSAEEAAWEGKEKALKKMKAAMDTAGGAEEVAKGPGGLNGWIIGYAGDLRKAGPGKRLEARFATLLASSKNYGKDVGRGTPLSKTHDYLLGKLTVDKVLGKKPKGRAKARGTRKRRRRRRTRRRRKRASRRHRRRRRSRRRR